MRNRALAKRNAVAMKPIVWLISALNLYIGLRCFLNAVHVLHTTKYSPTATAIFAVLFLGMGVTGFYFAIAGKDPRLVMLVGLGPWLLALLILFVTMVTSSYQ
jgi:hypothetical protein